MTKNKVVVFFLEHCVYIK